MHAAVTDTLAAASDDELLTRLELLTRKPWFRELTWMWGPEVAKRDRVRFRPFLLSAFSSLAIDKDGKPFNPWKGPTAAALEAWLAQVDAADDVEQTKRLYGWKLEHAGKQLESVWQTQLLERYRTATTPSARYTVLRKLDPGWLSLDSATALALYTVDAAAARAFILDHLPWQPDLAKWRALFAASHDDKAFHFDLYRRLVDEKTWTADVLALPGENLDEELQRRHPRRWLGDVSSVFKRLLEKHGERAIPYVARHAGSITSRWFFGEQAGKGLRDLMQLAEKSGWFDLWTTLLRTSAPRDVFDSEVRKLASSNAPGARGRLERIPGRGRELNMPGVSFASVHTLSDETATLLYKRYPSLVRGPFRLHISSMSADGFSKLTRAVLDAGDEELIDFLASRVAMSWFGIKADDLAPLLTHFEKLDTREFIRRAASVLTRMPAFAIWSYDALLKGNALARLLFERSTPMYLANGAAVRDLLESPQIHVQVLAFRILAHPDPRAAAIASQNRDLLQATLFRPLHRRTRLHAFAALARAGEHDVETARYLLDRMKLALSLPPKRYPTEKLVGLIGGLLHRWPELRGPRETPIVYGATA